MSGDSAAFARNITWTTVLFGIGYNCFVSDALAAT